MIKVIEEFEGTTALEQLEKMKEELKEIEIEILAGNIERELQEEADLVQTIYTRWHNMGLTKQDMEQVWAKHYEKETLRGRHVCEFKGDYTTDLTIRGLLKCIRKLEKKLAIYKMVDRIK